MSSARLLSGVAFSALPAVFDRIPSGESVVLSPPETVPPVIDPPGEPSLGVYSSGSTGAPKLAWSQWSLLLGNLSRPEPGRVWATPFQPWSFAGAQVALQAWRDRGVVCPLTGDMRANSAILPAKKVTALSCTPTFAQLLLIHSAEELKGWRPLQITLGGEPLPANLGARLLGQFPDARFTAVYASAEHGVLLKTHRLDGWYETAELTKRREWRVNQGELELGTVGGFRSTGDRVELREELMRIVGRMDDVVNVGGTKVSLAEVRSRAEEVAGVAEVGVVAAPSSVTGQVVKLRYTLMPGHEEVLVLERLQSHLHAVLPKAAWPRIWEAGPPSLGANAKQLRR